MNRSILLYLGIALIAFGLIGRLKIEIIVLGVLFLLSSLLIYSGRKARVRYWLQSYKYLKDKGLSSEPAISKLQEQFCESKYSAQNVCNQTFTSIDEFIVQVIQVEFKFEVLLKGDDVSWGLKKYIKLKEKLSKEIEKIKEELGL